MKDACECSGRAVKAGPAKFNPDDRYAKYRRMAKKIGLPPGKFD